MKTPAPLIDVVRIRAATFVQHVETYDEVESTNTRAVELARDVSVALPALVMARKQTSGRGRGGKSWWSAEGALTFSLLIAPSAMGIGSADWPLLSLTTAVAVCDVLRAEGLLAKLGIKWPNDVFFQDRKVCGILIESPGGSAPAKDRLVIGIGINVNNSCQNAPDGIRMLGTALCDVTGRQHDPQELLVRLLCALAERIQHLRSHDISELTRAWRQLDLLAGKQVVLEADNQAIDGKCVEIAHDGALVLETALGRRRYYSGSVRPA